MFLNIARGWLLILGSALLLGACSSQLVDPTTNQVKTGEIALPTETFVIVSPKPTLTFAVRLGESAIEENSATPTVTPPEEKPDVFFADVVSVQVSGAENNHQLSVEIRSPDTGCEQYADWWEVITEDGELIYRRILTHSHVSEQPFTRSGGPVLISADTVVIVRAHMHPDGYGGAAFRGSVQGGFEEILLDLDFATELERVDPLPQGCAF